MFNGSKIIVCKAHDSDNMNYMWLVIGTKMKLKQFSLTEIIQVAYIGIAMIAWG